MHNKVLFLIKTRVYMLPKCCEASRIKDSFKLDYLKILTQVDFNQILQQLENGNKKVVKASLV